MIEGAAAPLFYACKRRRSVNLNGICGGNIKDKNKSDMKWLTLKEIKEQLRIEPNFADEDDRLTAYGESAEDTVLNTCQRTYDDFISEYGEIPQPIREVSLMLVTLSYEQRSPVTQYQMYAVKYTFELKIKKYMRLVPPESDGVADETFIVGSDVKILIDAQLPDGLKMQDVDFTVVVYNNNLKDKEKTYAKSDCILTTNGDYVVQVDSSLLGIGRYLVRLTVHIPDTDYAVGYRKEVVKINPHIIVKG